MTCFRSGFAQRQGVGGGPPAPFGTIVLDTRPGGAQDFQAITTFAQVQAYWNASGGSFDASSGPCVTNFVTDFDGLGTHALRIDWPAHVGEASDNGSLFNYGTPLSEQYHQFDLHLGRTASGGGIGSIGQYTPVSNIGGRKLFRYYTTKGGGDNHYVAWQTNDISAQEWTLSSDANNLNVFFHTDWFVGQTIRWTVRLKIASSATASDGIFQIWANNFLVYSNLAVSGGSPNGLANFPYNLLSSINTYNNVQTDQSEYLTRMIIYGNP